MTEPQPSISVILPTHNRAALLPRAVASVLAQTLTDLELIVVDDASTDGTRAALAAFPDPRLRVLARETKQGAGAARNLGIGAARGEFVAFLDDDDFWLVQKLEKQVAAMRAAGPDVGWSVTGHLRIARRECVYVGGTRYERELDFRRGLGLEGPDWSLIATPGWVVRRDLLLQLGAFDDRIRSWDDWELGLRMAESTRRILVDEPLWIQDWIHGGGLIHAERARARDLRLIVEKHGHLWAGDPTVQARHWYVIGRAESLHDPAPAGRRALLHSLKLRPGSPKTWAALAMSYLGQPLTSRLTRLFREFKGRLA